MLQLNVPYAHVKHLYQIWREAIFYQFPTREARNLTAF